ncbi:DUF5129 domain-containing protein [Psychromicrobium lacuslunae]|uniref:DUF5129 domain-containing protein n=1 Tax=Psychromicrobium lacuslunae TaxID=1618207 RepID=A0A0D4BX07_9MICC|nr:DUF5129 domain-containing protein [Psychromicrobium lacuslunae]AJT40650.1 hypothetical protein UM93_02300 [Psychromicrobium lacuslunae]
MRTVKRLLSFVAALFFAGMLSAPAAFAEAPSKIVVEDTAGVLYQPQLLAELQKIDFYLPTQVVIYTRNGKYSDNLNEELLKFARTKHPEWISGDGQKWANGLYIFVLDPIGRQVGTYFGEDRKLSLDDQKNIQESTKKMLREAQWTDGVVQGVKSAAELIGRPWYRSPGLYWASGIIGGGGLLSFGGWQLYRANNRQKFADQLALGTTAYTSVSLNLEVTELDASTIPASSKYGSKLLERWQTFSAKYRELTEAKDRLESMSKKQRSKKPAVSAATDFANASQELDGLDDAIADANSLLNLSSNWRTAWESQVRDFSEELDSVKGMLANSRTAGSEETAAALTAQVTQSKEMLEHSGAGLADGSVTPDQALDSLKDSRTLLASLLSNHADAVIAANTKSDREAELMRQKLQEEENRNRQSHRYPGSIVDTSYPNIPLISIMSFQSGISAGQSAVETSRTSSSSSSTGYGSSGGSFSGSGSSSHF